MHHRLVSSIYLTVRTKRITTYMLKHSLKLPDCKHRELLIILHPNNSFHKSHHCLQPEKKPVESHGWLTWASSTHSAKLITIVTGDESKYHTGSHNCTKVILKILWPEGWKKSILRDLLEVFWQPPATFFHIQAGRYTRWHNLRELLQKSIGQYGGSTCDGVGSRLIRIVSFSSIIILEEPQIR